MTKIPNIDWSAITLSAMVIHKTTAAQDNWRAVSEQFYECQANAGVEAKDHKVSCAEPASRLDLGAQVPGVVGDPGKGNPHRQLGGSADAALGANALVHGQPTQGTPAPPPTIEEIWPAPPWTEEEFKAEYPAEFVRKPLTEKAVGVVDTRACTCPPNEAPVPCQLKYAVSECMKSVGVVSQNGDWGYPQRGVGQTLYSQSEIDGYRQASLALAKQALLKVIAANADMLPGDPEVAALEITEDGVKAIPASEFYIQPDGRYLEGDTEFSDQDVQHYYLTRET